MQMLRPSRSTSVDDVPEESWRPSARSTWPSSPREQARAGQGEDVEGKLKSSEQICLLSSRSSRRSDQGAPSSPNTSPSSARTFRRLRPLCHRRGIGSQGNRAAMAAPRAGGRMGDAKYRRVLPAERRVSGWRVRFLYRPRPGREHCRSDQAADRPRRTPSLSGWQHPRGKIGLEHGMERATADYWACWPP